MTRDKLDLLEAGPDSMTLTKARTFFDGNPDAMLRGRIATSLEFVENLIEDCRCAEGGCYVPGQNAKQYLSTLTVTRWIEMKEQMMNLSRQAPSERPPEAVFRQHFEDASQIVNDLMSYCTAACRRKERRTVCDMVAEDIDARYDEIVEAKGYLAYLADPTRSFEQNSDIARSYVADVRHFLQSPSPHFDAAAFLDKYKDIMSAYEFLGIACAFRSCRAMEANA